MDKPLRTCCRKMVKSMLRPYTKSGGRRSSPHSLRVVWTRGRRVPVSSALLQVGELAGGAVRVHLDLGHVELGLVDFAFLVEGDRTERGIVLAGQDLSIQGSA